ncbi:hypothetical protein BsWGS_23350 [Bradybaena similaris]
MSEGTGLDKLGIATGKHLNIALTTSSDPLNAIQEFQNVNGIDAESLKIALPFLDLHGVKRLTLNLSIFETVRERLLVELYNEAATEVKRQIWENNQALFGDEVQPLLAQYLKEKEWSLYRHDSPGLTYFSPTPKQRRQKETLTQLLEMIGSNVKLYDMVLQFLRTLFLRTRNTHYCTLRVELLMAIHDLELNSICSKDPCHKFTWCVDACIREKAVNTTRSRELHGFLDSVNKGQEFVLGDLSMVLADPYAMHIILQSLMKMLQNCVNIDTLPRENTDLQLLCRMTALGLNAWEMIDKSNFREPKLEPAFFTKFLAYMVTLMAEDQVRFFNGKIPGEVVVPPPLPPDMYANWISQYPLASMVAMYYCLQCARMKDRLAVTMILPTLIHCESNRAYTDTFLHCLSSYLIHMKDDFQHDDFCIAVLDDFFMPAVSREHVLRHLLRLLTYVHHRLPRHRLESAMEEITQDKDMSDSVRSTIEILQEKIANHEPSPIPSPEKMDSPLMSVPAPTPAPHR